MIDKNNATDNNNIKTVIHAGGSVVSVCSTCTDQVTQVRPHVSPVDTETLSREPFKDGSIHNTHWTPANRGN